MSTQSLCVEEREGNVRKLLNKISNGEVKFSKKKNMIKYELEAFPPK